jgi:Cu(I)/Ag(I) efflux system membrane fusion protein
MKNLRQYLIGAGLLLGAIVVVALQLRGEDPTSDAQAVEGHDMASMGAAGEQTPVRLNPEDARRIGVTFAEVESKVLRRSLQTLGTVTYDETRLATVTPKIEGWVERLFVDFTGAPVQVGQPLLAVYSPGLVTAQEELILASRLVNNAREGRATESARELLASARRRLEYWDISREEIDRIEATGEITKTLTLRAPASGVVVEKNIVEGDRIMPGMTIYRIADLSRVWIEADVFEKDLGLVREGLTATGRFESYPGREFPARVTYVYPTVSMQSRTGRVRLELENPNQVLKPGMYADIELALPPSEPATVIPRSALLSTGERSLVFVRAADGTLEPREVTPGQAVGREVEVLAGLQPGERVVSSAAFLVDAESNLGALTAGMEAVPDSQSPDTTMDHSIHQGAPADTTDGRSQDVPHA